ncbi:hypothetical protein AB1Y20_007214 [Prymnesium parvum]|uniref:Uncharacterized protein n=1 Tax=Prymnesium parvum TaxID=97485 RepID=A0AB34IUI2_PRYPA
MAMGEEQRMCFLQRARMKKLITTEEFDELAPRMRSSFGVAAAPEARGEAQTGESETHVLAAHLAHCVLDAVRRHPLKLEVSSHGECASPSSPIVDGVPPSDVSAATMCNKTSATYASKVRADKESSATAMKPTERSRNFAFVAGETGAIPRVDPLEVDLKQLWQSDFSPQATSKCDNDRPTTAPYAWQQLQQPLEEKCGCEPSDASMASHASSSSRHSGAQASKARATSRSSVKINIEILLE